MKFPDQARLCLAV